MSKILKAFQKERIDRGESAGEVAERMGISRRYLYDVIRFPDKNQKIYQKVLDYINKTEEA